VQFSFLGMHHLKKIFVFAVKLVCFNILILHVFLGPRDVFAINYLLSPKDLISRQKVGSGSQTFTITTDHTVTFSMQSGIAWGQGGEIVFDFTTTTNGQNGSATGNKFFISATSTWVISDFSVTGDSLTTIDSINAATSSSPVHSDLIYSGSACATSGASRVAIALVSKTDGSEPIFGFKRCGSGASGATSISITINGESATNGQIGNPSTTGTYAVTLLHKTGATYNNSSTGNTMSSQGQLAIQIISNDQLALTATTSPIVSFTVQSITSLSSCNSSITDSGGSFSFPNPLLRQAINSSQNWICIYLNSNSGTTTKGRVYVNSVNGVLTTQSGYPPAVTCTATTCIPDEAITTPSSSALAIGTEGYGLCVDTSGGNTNATATSPFNASPCTIAATNSTVGTAGKNQQEIWSTTSQAANAAILAKLSLSDTTPAGTYTDTILFIGVGIF